MIVSSINFDPNPLTFLLKDQSFKGWIIGMKLAEARHLDNTLSFNNVMVHTINLLPNVGECRETTMYLTLI